MNLEKINEMMKEITSNGAPTIGLAAGTDTILSSDKKLPVLKKSGNITLTEYITASLTNLTAHNVTDSLCKKLTVAAVIAVFKYDLVRIDKMDMDCRLVTDNGDVKITEEVTTTDVKNALSLIIATKVNFFTSNHHTGQGIVSGYPLKTIKTLYPNADLNAMTDLLHTIGHWANTPLTLRHMGMITDENVVGTGLGMQIVIGNDIKMRMESMPAGTAKLGLCHVILGRIINTKLFNYVPSVSMLVDVEKLYNKVKENREGYHINAKAITGIDRLEYNDNALDNALAILATFNVRVYNSSSVNKSPLITGANGDRFKDIEGYSSEFDKICVAFVKASRIKEESASVAFAEDLNKNDWKEADDARRLIIDLRAAKGEVEDLDEVHVITRGKANRKTEGDVINEDLKRKKKGA